MLRNKPDNFTLALLTTVALASMLPAAGGVARFFEGLTVAAVGRIRPVTPY